MSKKRKKPEKAKLAEEIEGYVGDRDLEYLTNYVTGNIASKEAAKDAAQSKEPVSTSKRKEKRNKQPIVGVSSSSSSNDSSANCSSNSSANGSTNVIVCSQNGDAESDQSETKTNTICNGVGSTTDTTSSTKMDLKKKVMVTNRPVSTDPKQDLNRSQKESSDGELSLFEVKQLLYIASDSEIPNSDPDSGFQTVKYKQLRRKKKTNGFANVPSTASHGRSGYTIENVNHPAHRMSNDSCLNRSSVVTNDRRPASNPKASATVSTGVSSSSETAGLSVQKAIVNDPILNSIHSISEYPQLQRNSLNSESVDCSLCTDQSDKIKEEESLPSEHFDSALDDEDSFGKVNSTADDSLSRISYAAIARKQYETPAKDTASQHHSSDSATRINEILPSAVEEELPIDVGEFNHKMEVRNKITGQKLDRNEKPKTNNHSKSGEGKSKKAKTSSPVKSIESVSLSSDSSPRDSSSSGKDSDSREFTDSSTGNSSKETLTATEKEDMSSESLPVVIICGDDKVDSNDSHSSTGSGSRIGTGSAASAASFTFGFFDEGAKDEGKQNESVDTTTTANTTTNATEDGTLPGQCTDDLRISPSVEQVEADVPVRSRSDSKSQAEQPEWRRKMQSNGVNNNASNNNNYHGPRFNQSKEGNVATAVVKQILFGNPNKSDVCYFNL